MYFLHILTYLVAGVAANALTWKHPDKVWNTTVSQIGPNVISTGSYLQPTPVPSSRIVEILIGDSGNLDFNPSHLIAAPDTLLQFDFSGQNFSLTHSFEVLTCLTGSRSSIKFNNSRISDVSSRLVVDYVVPTTDPMWFYCTQTIAKPDCGVGPGFILNPRNLTSVSENASLPVSSTKPYCNASAKAPTTTTLSNANSSMQPSNGPALSNMGSSSLGLAIPKALGLLALALAFL